MVLDVLIAVVISAISVTWGRNKRRVKKSKIDGWAVMVAAGETGYYLYSAQSSGSNGKRDDGE
jgi:hypothetical protein